MFLCVATLLLFSALSALAQVAPRWSYWRHRCSSATTAGNLQPSRLPIVPVQRLHIFPVRDPNAAAMRSGCAPPART